jgi:hypothetical protein
MVMQATMYLQRNAIVYKLGTRFPRNGTEASPFDASNGNTKKWQEAIAIKLDQLDKCGTSLTRESRSNGFKQINIHFVFECKQDL